MALRKTSALESTESRRWNFGGHTSLRRGGASFGRQLRIDQRLYLIPYFRITLNFRVRFHQHPIEPGIAFAADRVRFIVVSKVSHNLRTGRIGSANCTLAMHDSIRLVEIYRLPYIGGNKVIVLPDLGDAVDLNGEENRDAILLEFPRQRDCLRSTPAVSEDDNAGVLFFFLESDPSLFRSSRR